MLGRRWGARGQVLGRRWGARGFDGGDWCGRVTQVMGRGCRRGNIGGGWRADRLATQLHPRLLHLHKNRASGEADMVRRRKRCQPVYYKQQPLSSTYSEILLRQSKHVAFTHTVRERHTYRRRQGERERERKGQHKLWVA